ncbi:MAG TPA: aspartate-semialdehyde dehydrogenase [Armatimonadota bacterium]|nr:aspartate-semialdehyde dehydrogenase [Armatimonadota bacterium]HOM80608.1 aspartate-semialdehyde dehydrogenase [Armatimonadota bacterium]
MSQFTVAVVGVGAVGEEMLRVLAQRNFPAREIRALARSARTITVDGRSYDVQETTPEAFEGVDIALFAGTEGESGAAVTFAAEAVRRGAIVIDNGADFRMKPEVPLVVPEVNADAIEKHQGIISNPNCSTIQMVVALKPLHDAGKLKRVIVSTYQAVSGTGRAAIRELEAQVKAWAGGEELPAPSAYKYPIAFNLIPQIGSFRPDYYTSEEWKMIAETHKILGDDSIAISATTIRVPVFNSHSEAVTVETEEKITREEALRLLAAAPGIVVVDDPSVAGEGGPAYPMPIETTGKDLTYVGRVREDPFVPNTLHMWVVADNIRKGAATNAVQIAEALVERGLVGKK